ncbi:four-carbon acid sugar kinase family protein [Breznakiella homolactica]|uniref:Four-carbon acid sugar kinase family protein n=1 Tax=Breznakiella homolactica TaxID=2798577 RepID=A0A7T8B9P0_9SPIR|nr:four-carbon acid sugar kinase family protein [Breznakiella homolactica]QQO08672.1 four-carbon acid sugar kinase family protein [Breznakiella homolactica]
MNGIQGAYMVLMLIIADDFTGALDTGVQFAAKGIKTRVCTDLHGDYTHKSGVEVLVLDAETRQMNSHDAYETVFQIVSRARDAGVRYIYKKTDSALRGNIGSELAAVIDAADGGGLTFIPAYPKMGRTTKNGIHYIDAVPVAESSFGNAPIEPVLVSDVRQIIAGQSEKEVVLHTTPETAAVDAGRIHLYDIESDQEIKQVTERIGKDNLRLTAGCAGFAAVLLEVLEFHGAAPVVPPVNPRLLVACGSVNPITRRQMEYAAGQGITRVQLSPAQKLDPAWPESPQCARLIEQWSRVLETSGCLILDTNGSRDALGYVEEAGIPKEQLRGVIAGTLGRLVMKILDTGVEATLLLTGGDTLLGYLHAVGQYEVTPVCELMPGVVLSGIELQGKTYHIISKSGGFGEGDLIVNLLKQMGITVISGVRP